MNKRLEKEFGERSLKNGDGIGLLQVFVWTLGEKPKNRKWTAV
jgi:hypothetical protein